MRKIAANYIFLPGFSLVKNGYVLLEEQAVRVVDTGGVIREIAGLEFYGGLIVPDYVKEYARFFDVGGKILPVLEKLFREHGRQYSSLAIIEGADLREMRWLSAASVRLLR